MIQSATIKMFAIKHPKKNQFHGRGTGQKAKFATAVRNSDIFLFNYKKQAKERLRKINEHRAFRDMGLTIVEIIVCAGLAS